jgi:hypothetical protein
MLGRMRRGINNFVRTGSPFGFASPESVERANQLGYKIKNIIWKNPAFPGGNSAYTAQFSMMLMQPR